MDIKQLRSFCVAAKLRSISKAAEQLNIGQPVVTTHVKKLEQELNLADGDAVFFVCGVPKSFFSFAAAARLKIGADLGLSAADKFRFCWIVDYPMYE